MSSVSAFRSRVRRKSRPTAPNALAASRSLASSPTFPAPGAKPPSTSYNRHYASRHCGDARVLLCAGLPVNVRSRSGQPCSLCRAVDLCVLRPARRIHIRLRGRVLHNSPPPASVRPALAPTVTALGTLGCWAPSAAARHSLRGKARLLPRAASTIRVTMLRRRDTASSPRSRLVSHHANRRRAVPLRSLLPSVDLGPTFRCGAFFFVALALADVPSASLIITAYPTRP